MQAFPLLASLFFHFIIYLLSLQLSHNKSSRNANILVVSLFTSPRELDMFKSSETQNNHANAGEANKFANA